MEDDGNSISVRHTYGCNPVGHPAVSFQTTNVNILQIITAAQVVWNCSIFTEKFLFEKSGNEQFLSCGILPLKYCRENFTIALWYFCVKWTGQQPSWNLLIVFDRRQWCPCCVTVWLWWHPSERMEMELTSQTIYSSLIKALTVLLQVPNQSRIISHLGHEMIRGGLGAVCILLSLSLSPLLLCL